MFRFRVPVIATTLGGGGGLGGVKGGSTWANRHHPRVGGGKSDLGRTGCEWVDPPDACLLPWAQVGRGDSAGSRGKRGCREL